MRRLTDLNPILWLMWSGLLAFAIGAVALGNVALAFVALVTFALSVAPVLLAYRLDISVPTPFLVATTAFITASIFLGEAFGFYDRVWWWDMALHGASAVGFGLFGFLFIFMLFEGDRYAAPPGAVAFLAFCLAVTVGSVWEVFEFAMDQFFGLNMQKSGLDATMGDLIVNAIGASVGAISGLSFARGREGRLLAPFIRQFIDATRRLYRKAIRSST